MPSFINDFNKANTAVAPFLNFINSLTREGKQIIEIETSDNEVLKMFDKYSGIDAVQVTKDNQMRTIAMRVQYGKAWDTYTIRYKRASGAKTEYEKRVEAIKNEKVYPHLTIQCYLSNDLKEVLSVGIVRTKDLYDQIEKRGEICKYRTVKEDGNIFMYIDFRSLDNVFVYSKDRGVTYNNRQRSGTVDVASCSLQ